MAALVVGSVVLVGVQVTAVVSVCSRTGFRSSVRSIFVAAVPVVVLVVAVVFPAVAAPCSRTGFRSSGRSVLVVAVPLVVLVVAVAFPAVLAPILLVVVGSVAAYISAPVVAVSSAVSRSSVFGREAPVYGLVDKLH